MISSRKKERKDKPLSIIKPCTAVWFSVSDKLCFWFVIINQSSQGEEMKQNLHQMLFCIAKVILR